MAVDLQHDKEKGWNDSPPPNDLQPVTSVHSGQSEEKKGDFHRSFTTRQVHIISLGSNIGSGVFIGTGKALAAGGPGNMIIAYLDSGFLIS